jgi:hypothetical protein
MGKIQIRDKHLGSATLPVGLSIRQKKSGGTWENNPAPVASLPDEVPFRQPDPV